MNLDPQHYGATVAFYKGTGALTLADDSKIDCEFAALQLINGKIIVLGSASTSSFRSDDLLITQLSGKTEDGYQLVAARFFVSGLTSRWSVNSGSAIDFRLFASRLEIANQTAPPHFWRFQVLNANLPSVPNGISISHPFGLGTLRRATDYDAVVDRLRIGTEDFARTAEIEIHTDSRQNAETIAEDVCYLLSIACGTKVQWIVYDECDAGRQLISRVHCNKVTKRYVPLSTIDYREPHDTEQFLQSTITTFVQRKREWELSIGLIDSYLDAKQDADHMEIRALKLVAAVERFKRVFIEVTGYQEFAIGQEEFETISSKLQKQLSGILTDLGLDEGQRKVVYANLKGANRRSFGDALDAIHEFLKIGISVADRKLFVNCRNRLIHDGRFYCESASVQDRSRIPPRPGKAEEYYWILHFTDRLFLRVLGYEGPYVDWSQPGDPIRRQRVTLSSNAIQGLENQLIYLAKDQPACCFVFPASTTERLSWPPQHIRNILADSHD